MEVTGWSGNAENQNNRKAPNWARRDGTNRAFKTDSEAENVPRVLPKDEDPSLVKRNRRMLGQLLGTLEKFRKEDVKLSGSEACMRRNDSLKRAEQRAREESEILRQQERETIVGKRRRDLVKVIPEVNSTKLNKEIMSNLVRVHRNTDLGMKLPVYDGRRALYTAGTLPFTSKEFTVTILDDLEWIGITKERKFTVTIEFVAHASMCQLRELLSGKQVDTPLEALKIVDLVLKELTAQRYISVGIFFCSPNITNPKSI